MTTLFDKEGLPEDLLSPKVAGSRRLKTTSTTRLESVSLAGKTFVGSTSRLGVLIGDIQDTIFRTGDKYAIINAINVSIDFSNISIGNFTQTIEAAVDASNGNTFTFTPAAPLPAGRPINAEFINDFPLATVDVGVVGTTFSGTFDYGIFREDYYLEVQGSRAQISSTGSSFFDTGKIIIPPNTDVLIRAISTGDAIGTVDILTTFFISELTAEEIG